MACTAAIVTRPAASAQPWVAALQAAGLAAEALPLLDIRPEPDRVLQPVRQRLADWQAVLFVSGNAVRCFVGASGWKPPDGPRGWSPGPGTTAALRAAGWPAEAIDAPAADAAQFDSEHLWQQVAPQVRPGVRVLIVRGADAQGRVSGRQWLAQAIGAAGGQVQQLASYRRLAPGWSNAQLARARRAAADGSVWVFSSRQALAHLVAALPRQHWALALAVATHPRIAQAARAAGFGRVQASQPVLADVVQSVKALCRT